jgi:hypothetical protein
VSALAELPEGPGLAAQYPGDAGIERDAAVVFADGFEEIEDVVIETTAYEQRGKRWDGAWGLLRITREPERVHSGRQALEISHQSMPARSHGAEKNIGPGCEALFVRYYLMYDREFPGLHHSGMAIAGFPEGVPSGESTGVRPNGRNHFTVGIDAVLRDRTGTPPGVLEIGCYHMDQGRKWGDLLFATGEVYPRSNQWLLGQDFVPRPQLTPERGRWYCYELMVKVNTPGERDGRVAFWVDGKLAGDFPKLRLRSVPVLKANRINIYTYSSRRRPHTRLWYDDIVAATTYIGPQVGGSPG